MTALPAPVTAAHALAIEVACAGCGHRAGPVEPFPIRCPRRLPGDDIDHVMTRRIDPAVVRLAVDDDPDPFVRHRELFRAYHVARSAGQGDAWYVDLVRRLDAAVAVVDGAGFRTTPFDRQPLLGERIGFTAPGGIWVKDETCGVSGSHKARHLMGVMLELLVEEAVGRLDARPRALAIASCGNAALAAAVVARAAERPLLVFVPTWADPVVVGRLKALGARIEVCPRQAGTAGDPTVRRLAEAIDAGAIPFTCQGSENGLAIEGGETLGFEIVDQLGRQGVTLDRIVVQVGGGALASAVAAALAEARSLGAIERLPRFDTVQTSSAWPLKRAYIRVVETLRGAGADIVPGRPLDLGRDAIRSALDEVARSRSTYMWPWETEPRSVAHGILDDETYDWLAVVRAMLQTGGRPLVVDEATLVDANELALATTAIDADHTGTAGLAGLLELLRHGDVRPDETVAVLFTGARRGPSARDATMRPREHRAP